MIAAIARNDEAIKAEFTETCVSPVVRPNTDYPWLHGRVPVGYWDLLDNRRLYLAWLGQRCGFQSLQDWYKVRQKHFKQNSGGGLLANNYGFSLQLAVAELFPNETLIPWMFGGVPQRFWKSAINRRAYMKWLGTRLGYSSPTDWYKITKNQFYKNRGGGLLANYYGDSPQRALREFMPNEEWVPWMFQSVPQSFWKLRANRMRYMDWMAERSGLEARGGWGSIRTLDFVENSGGGLLVYHYGGSVEAAVRDYLRDYEWDHAKAKAKARSVNH